MKQHHYLWDMRPSLGDEWQTVQSALSVQRH